MARPRRNVASPIPTWARKIRLLRESLGLSQQEFARMLHSSTNAISRWERGMQSPPPHQLIALGKIAGGRAGWYYWQLAGITAKDIRRMFGNSCGDETDGI